ncbi:nucleotidyl transferase AbiEii/AbiGii toxin family protein [Mesorhizobium sp. M1409]|uniref:nucleotidyl transferase AbiEii/AbiGii toxin family protein n=1 Tax=unclassified Mesorhizobium TaxID=325217 RepID=UPI00333D8B58
MIEVHSRRPSEWRRLFAIAADLIDQLREKAGGFEFEWSFGGGTAMMIQINHRESHDVDIFLDDPQLLGFIDPSKSQLSFSTGPAAYDGDGTRFQKFAFEGLGEIDFIVAGALTGIPFEKREVEGRSVWLETIPEIIAKKVYYRGAEARPRDIFDIAAAARSHRAGVVGALRAFPDRVARTRERLAELNPEFVRRTIAQLMIMPDYEEMAADSLAIATALLEEVLSPATSS